jgi:hypothetical protein
MCYLARFDVPGDTAAFSDTSGDCDNKSIIILETTLTHPNPDTGVHGPHRTAAAAPYCRVLTVARFRNG